jgi:hypothetical protein
MLDGFPNFRKRGRTMDGPEWHKGVSSAPLIFVRYHQIRVNCLPYNRLTIDCEKLREMSSTRAMEQKKNREMNVDHLPTRSIRSDSYIRGVNMMCALGVPAFMIHGPFSCRLSLSPVVSEVA